MNKEKLHKRIIETLETIFDPELPVNIYALGLIYEIKINDDAVVDITMTLTTPNCPVAESLPMEVNQKVATTEGVKGVNLNLTFEPTWDKEMISEEGKLELGFL